MPKVIQYQALYTCKIDFFLVNNLLFSQQIADQSFAVSHLQQTLCASPNYPLKRSNNGYITAVPILQSELLMMGRCGDGTGCR